MFRRIGWFIGLNNHSYSAKRLPDAKPRPAKVKPVAIMDTTQEIAIYIHRFHNLDLFQQGWYQIKITMKWEDGEHGSPGTPARVVQYEVPDLGSEDIHGIWRINDTDNSFSTQPFRIKYARQDVLLSIMVSFNLPLGKFEGLSTSAVVLKFELMYAPISESGSGLQASLDSCAAAVHEFRIPPKALLGLHSYCPVHFDAFHAVLVDTTVHISLLKSSSVVAPPKVNRDSRNVEELSGENIHGLGQAVGPVSSFDERQLSVLRALLASRDLLVEELQNLSKAIDQPIDLTDVTAKVDDKTLIDLRAELGIEVDKVLGPDKLQNGIEKANQNVDTRNDGLLYSASREDLFHSFHVLGNQVLYLWNTFLQFHRANKTSIMEYLRDAWATDRRAEWSIWMVYTKVEMPLHYIHSGADEPTHHGVHRRVSSLWKLADDPAQSAAMRADLHRRSIAQMRINSRSIQDMHIFGDPSRIPIVIVERVVNAPRRTVSVNSYFNHMNLKDYPGLSGPSYDAAKKPSTQQSGRVLKAVIFVHGFQGNHLDLRLVRNQWLLIDPKIEFLMSEVNEDKTSGDFKEMGQRLAQEVISFLKKKMDKISRSGSLRNIKLSFVGHSIGNIIIRTALTEGIMEPYLRYLYTYISISGPHLGYLYSSNSLFNSGLWLLKKFKGTQCIHQLTFTDDLDLQNTFLYKLCKQKTLESFRHIILLSSPQDGYVPYHSARIELCQASSSDYSKKGKIFLEMLNDCLDQIRAPSSEHRVFMRCDVNFDTSSQGRNLNTLIGRAAHIEFLETDAFARFVMWSFPELFR
ncbi:hypothetical protein EUGRSUZ_F02184 [Eucalyptus grandis]|uniref:DUF676 domain-containing protein n=2 Tax=Eucalyptus grandis TaxID=71139 RepID=A0A059BRK4_EUCGR|nr:hypothetical protein EUGRSUZ_F02184 [Eucalyptus grandis]